MSNNTVTKQSWAEQAELEGDVASSETQHHAVGNKPPCAQKRGGIPEDERLPYFYTHCVKEKKSVATLLMKDIASRPTAVIEMFVVLRDPAVRDALYGSLETEVAAMMREKVKARLAALAEEKKAERGAEQAARKSQAERKQLVEQERKMLVELAMEALGAIGVRKPVDVSSGPKPRGSSERRRGGRSGGTYCLDCRFGRNCPDPTRTHLTCSAEAVECVCEDAGCKGTHRMDASRDFQRAAADPRKQATELPVRQAQKLPSQASAQAEVVSESDADSGVTAEATAGSQAETPNLRSMSKQR